MSDVPCNGCTRCCTGPVMIHPSLGDDLANYPSARFVEGAGFVLPTREDNSCFYLKDGGCSIYDKRPALCRAFDCRVYARQTSAILSPYYDQAVIDRGEQLLAEKPE